MSAFQDFGPLTERRRAERQQRRRKHLMIAGASISVILIIAVVGAAVVLYHPNGTTNTNGKSTTAASSSSKALGATSKAIETVCSATDYKQQCEKSLSHVANSSSHVDPKSLIRTAVSAISTEIATSFDHAAAVKSDDPKVKGAVDYCKQLLNDSKTELLRTLDGIDMHHLSDIPKKGYMFRNWLSAVMTYQENCIDAFPDGDFKNKMIAAMNSSKEVTSNALAIIGKASSFLKTFDIPGFNRRRLLAAFNEFDQEPAFHDDGFPWWVPEADRRHLKERAADKLKPNVVVAKDGSGNFTTISAALAALPKKYEGRYMIYVKTGEYDEHVDITKNMVNLTMYGDGSQKTIVTGNRNFVDGWRTFETATFEAMTERDSVGRERPEVTRSLQWLVRPWLFMPCNKFCLVSKVPLGVVLAIPPFNYHVNLAVSKIAHALIAGNALVLKPPTQGAVAPLHMVQCFHLAGFPKGLISCITGKGSEIGDFLIMHPGVNCISFTGGDTGISISNKVMAAAILKAQKGPIADCPNKEIVKPAKDSVAEVVRSRDLVLYTAEKGYSDYIDVDPMT